MPVQRGAASFTSMWICILSASFFAPRCTALCTPAALVCPSTCVGGCNPEVTSCNDPVSYVTGCGGSCPSTYTSKQGPCCQCQAYNQQVFFTFTCSGFNSVTATVDGSKCKACPTNYYGKCTPHQTTPCRFLHTTPQALFAFRVRRTAA